MRLLYLITSLFIVVACSGPPVNSENNDAAAADPADPYERLRDYLSSAFQGWVLPGERDYDRSWWSFYDKSSVPSLVIADFNDDAVADYAVLLQKEDSLKLVFVLGSGPAFSSVAVETIKTEQPDRGLVNGLTVEPPGRIDVAYPAIRSLILRSNAVNFMELEVRKAIYYWENGTIGKFETS